MKILLVDANNLAYRNYYAQNLKSSTGQNTGMIYGFISSMLSAIRDLSPDLIYYVWDPKGGSAYRKQLYGLYKGNRDSKGPEFFEEMSLLKQCLTSLGTCQITKQDVEADDVIGYLSGQFNQDTVYIYSNDKDVLQLISTNVHVYQPDKGLVQLSTDGTITIKEQSKTIAIRPDQVPDYKALVGDASDNYPGLPGFGIGAAIKYFQLNERANAVINGTANLSNQRSNVLHSIMDNRAMVSVWLDLATINIAEGYIDQSYLIRSDKDQAMVTALFEQLEFKQFLALGDIVFRIGGQ